MQENRPILRGDVWLYDPGHIAGHEQANVRPGLVVSRNDFHTAATELIILVPITTKKRDICSHVPLKRVKGLEKASYAISEQVRCISHRRLIRRMATVDPRDLPTIENWLRIILQL